MKLADKAKSLFISKYVNSPRSNVRIIAYRPSSISHELRTPLHGVRNTETNDRGFMQ